MRFIQALIDLFRLPQISEIDGRSRENHTMIFARHACRSDIRKTEKDKRQSYSSHRRKKKYRSEFRMKVRKG